MIKLSPNAIAINAGAGLIIVIAAISAVHTTFARPYVEVCSARYNRQLSLPLDRDGQARTAGDLQTISNGQDEGVTDNLSVAAVDGGPSKFAMGVRLAGGSTQQRGPQSPGGISMPWAPSLINQPRAACLSYSIFLPDGFEFDEGGTLPGLYATTINGQYVDTPHVSVNLSWQARGEPKLFVESRAADAQNAGAFQTYERALPLGRWLRVDQELILNTPGQPDGAVRLWFDGKLETEIKAADLRPDDSIAIAGVAGDVFFGGSGTTGTAKAEATVWVSPFELRWN